MDISETQLQKQLQQLQTLLRQQQQRQQQRPVVRSKPPSTRTQHVADVLTALSRQHPRTLETTLASMGYHKIPQETMLRAMDQDFEQIKQSTQAVLASPKTTTTMLQKTSAILGNVLKHTTPRYRTRLQNLKKKVDAKIRP